MKILFAGTGEIAVPSLIAVSEEFEVVGVLTSPDKPTGRGRRLAASAVKVAAVERAVPVLQPSRLDSVARSEVKALEADLMVVFAYGRIFGPKFLDLFPSGAINLHPSMLPRHRGPSPITAAILAGDEQSALTVQRVGLEMDAGDIISQRVFKLTGTETTATLSEWVAEEAAGELQSAIRAIETGSIETAAQDHSAATYCSIVKKQDGLIDWKDSAESIERMVRAYQPWPKARTELMGKGLAILESGVRPKSNRGTTALPGTVLGVDTSQGILVQTGDGVLGVTKLQAATKKATDFKSFLNGVKLENGTQLGGGS